MFEYAKNIYDFGWFTVKIVFDRVQYASHCNGCNIMQRIAKQHYLQNFFGNYQMKYTFRTSYDNTRRCPVGTAQFSSIHHARLQHTDLTFKQTSWLRPRCPTTASCFNPLRELRRVTRYVTNNRTRGISIGFLKMSDTVIHVSTES